MAIIEWLNGPVVTTNTLKCRGRNIVKDENMADYRFEAALDNPVYVLATTFSNGAKSICCPHLLPSVKPTNSMVCKATDAFLVGDTGKYPYCPYY